MKKIIITSVIALLCMNAMAQDRRGVAVGVNLTGNFTAYTAGTGWADSKLKPNIGYGAGLFVTIPIAKRFSIQAEVQYDALRASLNPKPRTIPLTAYKASSSREYLTIPLMLQYEFGQKHKFFVNFGPSLKFTLASSYRMMHHDHSSTNNSQENITLDYILKVNNKDSEHRMVVALVAGFGMKIPVAKKVDFIWEARLSGDISRVINPNNNQYLDGTQALNLALRAGVAYRF